MSIGELPSPASFEKTPRATPYLKAIQTVAPAKPPVAAVVVNAEVTIKLNTYPTWFAFKIIISKPPRI